MKVSKGHVAGRLTVLTMLLLAAGCVSHRCPLRSGARARLRPARLFATLPPASVTPDGLAVCPDGHLIFSSPNFSDTSKPGCLFRIDKTTHAVSHWVDVPPLPETGVAFPMGIAFGPDGDIYVADNQGWPGTPQGQFKGRLLRLRIRDNRVVATTVMASDMEHPNGVRVRGGHLYVTQSLLTRVKDPSGLLVSAVYRFRLDDRDIKVSNTLDDPNLLATFITQNPFCQYGADGLAFDSHGNLFVGNFGDGAIHKLTFGPDGRVASNTLFARTDHDYSLDPARPDFLAQATRARMRTVDGIYIDARDNIYVADFSNNAVAKVTPRGRITVLAQNGDVDSPDGRLDQPGEPAVWNGKLIVTNFDAVFGPGHLDKVNTRHNLPATLSFITLEP